MSMNENLIPLRRFKEFQKNNKWKNYRLIEISDYRNGKAHEQNIDTNGEYIVVNAKFVSTNGRITKKSNRLIEPLSIGEIAFVLSDVPNGKALAKTFLVAENKRYTLNQRIAGITPHEGIDSHFLYNLLNRNQYFLKFDNGVGQTNLSKSDVENFIGKYPLLEEQQRIGEFFANLDGLIASQQRKLNKTKAMKSAYLSEMFPADGESKPKRRFSGFTDDWEQGTIGDFGSFHYGKSAPKWSVTQDATTPCVRYGELYTKYNEKIDTIYSFTNIPKDNLRFSTGKEVLVPRVGEDPLDFANCSWISIPGVAIGEMISVYNTKQNPLFTAYMFNTLLKKEFAKRVEGGNVSNLYYTYLENISVSYPSIEEQEKISSFFDSLSNNIASQQQKLDKLKDMKKAYLNEMFI